jgi:hypothetical protein
MQILLRLVLAGLVLGLASCTTPGRVHPMATLNTQQPDGEFPGWKSFSEKPGTATGDVWRLGKDGVLVCQGAPRGYLQTERNYTNFKIELDWRFPAGSTQSNGGLLVRKTGDDSIWPKSLEIQLNQKQAGDFWGIRAFTYTGPEDRYNVLTNTQFGTLRHLKKYRDMEKPAGQWNHFEGLVEGDTAKQWINGVGVNKAVGCDVVSGKILLTAEGQEIHFRNVRITPLP